MCPAVRLPGVASSRDGLGLFLRFPGDERYISRSPRNPSRSIVYYETLSGREEELNDRLGGDLPQPFPFNRNLTWGNDTKVTPRSSEQALPWRTQLRGPMRCRGCCVRKALCATICLVERVIAQTQARVFHSQNHFPEKLLSLFEPHSVVIRKGKPHKPNEFGRLVRIDEVEDGIVSGYEVSVGNRADQPALEHHVALFGRTPRLAAADRGYGARIMSS